MQQALFVLNVLPEHLPMLMACLSVKFAKPVKYKELKDKQHVIRVQKDINKLEICANHAKPANINPKQAKPNVIHVLLAHIRQQDKPVVSHVQKEELEAV
jgi:hypothetical protein